MFDPEMTGGGDDLDDGAISMTGVETGGLSFAQAGLEVIGNQDKRGDPGRLFTRMKSMFAGSEFESPQGDHTLIAVRDSGFSSLGKDQQARLDPEKHPETARAILDRHHLTGYVSESFLNGEEASSMTLPTLDPTVHAVIFAPRIPKSQLPAGARLEEPIIQMVNSRSGMPIKQLPIRASKKNQNYPGQKILVVNEPFVTFK